MAPDDAPDKPLVAEVVEAALLAVALPGGVEEGEVLRRAFFGQRVVTEKTLLQRDGDVLGEADADETAGGNGVAVADETDGFSGGDNLAAFLDRVLRIFQQGVRSGGHGRGLLVVVPACPVRRQCRVRGRLSA